jgi:hypothetical protein
LKRGGVLGFAAALTALVVAVGAPAADASTKVCRGVLGPVAVENVVVPAHASCLLDATQVSGSVTVLPGGSLRATIGGVIAGDIVGTRDSTVSISRIGVGGDVECSGCRRVNIFESEVAGSVHLRNTVELISVAASTIVGDLEVVAGAASVSINRGGVSGELVIAQNTGSLVVVRQFIGGDATIVDNVSPLGFTLTENQFGASLTFSRNLGPSALSLNTIATTLACFGNEPPPTGSGNVAAAVEGQCVGL